jgi:hypothetical protein
MIVDFVGPMILPSIFWIIRTLPDEALSRVPDL